MSTRKLVQVFWAFCLVISTSLSTGTLHAQDDQSINAIELEDQIIVSAEDQPEYDDTGYIEEQADTYTDAPTNATETTSYTTESPSELSSVPHTITVYVDASWGKRTKGAAAEITRSHAEQAAQGYRFVDLELYTEDADLKGFFITYMKDRETND